MPGFATDIERQEHFYDHGSDFGAADVTEYERMAVSFLGPDRPMGVLQCSRRRGDVVRFDPTSNTLGVMALDGTIRTYFKPVRCIDLAAALAAIKRCHDFATHMEYFRECCRLW